MSNIKKGIIVLSIILIITVITLVVILLINGSSTGEEGQTVTEDEGLDAYQKEIDTTLVSVDNIIDFYTVKDCVGKYYSYYSILFNAGDYYSTGDANIIEQAEKDNAQVLYNMLDSEYTSSKGISAENIKENLTEIGQITANITDMYVSQKTDNIDIYVVEGKLKEGISDKGTDFKIIVKLDVLNRTFSIIPQEYVIEKYNNITVGQKVDIIAPENIEKNDNNQFTYKTVTEENYMKDLFTQLKNELLYDRELAYNHIDEAYKTKKFNTLDVFESYIIENEDEFKAMTLSKYQVTEQDGYTQYVLVDQNDNYYILNETSAMNYTTLFDTYTVDLPQFIEKYNESNNAEKAGLNMQKVIDAMNNKDYSYVYSKLDDTFKENNFPTEASFEEYIQKELYTSINAEYSNYKSSGSLHMYDVTFSDKSNENSEKITKTFIIKLLEGTDFVMSFNV